MVGLVKRVFFVIIRVSLGKPNQSHPKLSDNRKRLQRVPILEDDDVLGVQAGRLEEGS